MIWACILGALLAAIAVVSLFYQLKNYRRVRTIALASTEKRYLLSQWRRRVFNGFMMVPLSTLLIYAYTSDFQQQIDDMGERRKLDRERPLDDTEKAFVRWWSFYWIAALALLFVVVLVAFIDYRSTAKYGLQEMKRLRTEERALLERDLALYRQQRDNDRLRSLGE